MENYYFLAYRQTDRHTLTIAHDTSILIMITVVDTPAWEAAVSYAGLIASTLQIVHPYRSSALTK